MTEEQFLPKKDPFGESGRTIPPVEGAWSLMRRKLDARLPVTLPRAYSRAAWWWSGAGAVVLAATVTVVLLVSRSANHSLHPNMAGNSKVNASQVPGAALQPIGRNPGPGKDSVAAMGAAPAGLAGSTGSAGSAGSAGSTGSVGSEGAEGSAGSAREAAGTSAERANGAFRPGKGPGSGSARGEWAARHRWRATQEGSKAGSAEGKQSAGGADSGGAMSGEPVTGRAVSRRTVPGAVVSERAAREASVAHTGSVVQRSSVVHTSSLVQTEGIKHNQFCRVADSMLSALARRGGWETTLTGLAGKPKTLPGGYKSSKGKKDAPWAGKGLRMSAGISAGKTFPIGGQEANAYGANGKKAGLTDYIPHLYFRYYPRKNNYIQADLAIHSPQYTHSLVVDSFSAGTSTLPGWQSDPQYNTVTLKKLYYNDLGVSFHYRLFDGLWLGAGIQVSQLSNAVGRKDTMVLVPVSGGRDTVFGSEIYGMKSSGGDYNELPKKDWRVTLQAEYSWRRWMLSLVFKEAIRTYTDEFLYGYNDHYRNNSWGVYLSYDLWERKRKK